jgi:hypothetical protein
MMMNMIGNRLHPAVGIVLGLALIPLGIAADALVLALAGGVVAVAMSWRLVDSRRGDRGAE